MDLLGVGLLIAFGLLAVMIGFMLYVILFRKGDERFEMIKAKTIQYTFIFAMGLLSLDVITEVRHTWNENLDGPPGANATLLLLYTAVAFIGFYIYFTRKYSDR